MSTNLAHVWRLMFMLPRRFQQPEMENDFLLHYCQKFCSYRRLAILVGTFSWISFIGWDLYHSLHDPVFHQISTPLVAWRIAGFIFLLAISALSAPKRFASDETYASLLLITGNAGTYAISYWMMYLTPFPYDYMYYYFALLIGLVFAFSMLRLRARPTSLLMLFYVVTTIVLFRLNYLAKLEQLKDTASLIYMTKASTFQFVMATIGHVVGIQNERAERTSYLIENELKQNNDIVIKRNQEVENLNLALEQSNHEIIQKTNALIEIKENMRMEAERRNHEKSYFLANAVHDLRQPIQAISNVLEPIKFAIENNQVTASQELIRLAQDATAQMRNQLSAILEISRLESGYIKPEMESFDLIPLLKNVGAQLEPMARREQIELHQHQYAQQTHYVWSDKIFITRILLNIINNGMKYRRLDVHASSFVAVRVSNLPTCVRIEIEDNGIGIEEKHLTTGAIFKPFFQLENHKSESEKGVGLGLSIVQAMINLLPEHRLEVSSEPGCGSTFSIELPHASQRLANDVMPDQRRSLDEIRIRGKYIVVIEDDLAVLTSTIALLTAHGAIAEGVTSVSELGTFLEEMERIPDLILSDYRLPDGMTAINILNLIEYYCGNIPFLILTADAHGQTLSASDGRFRVLCKPISSDALLEAISDALHPVPT